MLIPKKLVIFALVIALAYAKRGKGPKKTTTTSAPPPPPPPAGPWDHLIHYNDANEGPQDQATQYVPGQPGIQFFMKLYYILTISL